MKAEFLLTDRVIAAFEGQYIPEPNSGCWLWLGPLGDGYGMTWSGTRTTGAHRLSWAIHRGAIPPKMTVDHRVCRVKCCVNPDHLVLCSHAENMLQPDGPLGILLARTHCRNGHEYTPENTIIRGTWRSCRECRKLGRIRIRASSQSISADAFRNALSKRQMTLRGFSDLTKVNVRTIRRYANGDQAIPAWIGDLLLDGVIIEWPLDLPRLA